MAKKYNRVMLGKGGCFADLCKSEGFIGVDFLCDEDLTKSLYEDCTSLIITTLVAFMGVLCIANIV